MINILAKIVHYLKMKDSINYFNEHIDTNNIKIIYSLLL